jgi:hypothetical protein
MDRVYAELSDFLQTLPYEQVIRLRCFHASASNRLVNPILLKLICPDGKITSSFEKRQEKIWQLAG